MKQKYILYRPPAYKLIDNAIGSGQNKSTPNDKNGTNSEFL